MSWVYLTVSSLTTSAALLLLAANAPSPDHLKLDIAAIACVNVLAAWLLACEGLIEAVSLLAVQLPIILAGCVAITRVFNQGLLYRPEVYITPAASRSPSPRKSVLHTDDDGDGVGAGEEKDAPRRVEFREDTSEQERKRDGSAAQRSERDVPTTASAYASQEMGRVTSAFWAGVSKFERVANYLFGDEKPKQR